MSQTEFETLMNTITTGFTGIHARIDLFKDEFNRHRIICAGLFSQIKIDEAVRQGEEKGIAKSLKDQIDWGKVKTYVVGLLLGVITLGALKILFTNIGKLSWYQ